MRLMYCNVFIVNAIIVDSHFRALHSMSDSHNTFIALNMYKMTFCNTVLSSEQSRASFLRDFGLIPIAM